MLFLKVPRSLAEKTRRELLEQGLFSKNYPVIRDGDFVLFPVKGKWKSFETVEIESGKRPERSNSLKEALSGQLSPSELDGVITSFDVIGDIAIMEIPEKLEPKEREMGEALLKVHKNVKSVFKKLSSMEGEFRVRKLRLIAGEGKTETIYKESGVKMKLDVSKVYFSPRLSAERKRIAELVREGERVLVLFAGVGPFALVIAKNKPRTKIVAVEINPDAVRYMRENMDLNKTKNIEAVEGDAKKLKLTDSAFDRVIMPLPKTAHEFLSAAFAAAKDGGIVHFYALADAKAPFDEAMERARDSAKQCGVSVEAESMRIVRPYSPLQVQVVLDLKVSKNSEGTPS